MEVELWGTERNRRWPTSFCPKECPASLQNYAPGVRYVHVLSLRPSSERDCNIIPKTSGVPEPGGTTLSVIIIGSDDFIWVESRIEEVSTRTDPTGGTYLGRRAKMSAGRGQRGKQSREGGWRVEMIVSPRTKSDFEWREKRDVVCSSFSGRGYLWPQLRLRWIGIPKFIQVIIRATYWGTKLSERYPTE